MNTEDYQLEFLRLKSLSADDLLIEVERLKAQVECLDASERRASRLLKIARDIRDFSCTHLMEDRSAIYIQSDADGSNHWIANDLSKSDPRIVVETSRGAGAIDKIEVRCGYHSFAIKSDFLILPDFKDLPPLAYKMFAFINEISESSENRATMIQCKLYELFCLRPKDINEVLEAIASGKDLP